MNTRTSFLAKVSQQILGSSANLLPMRSKRDFYDSMLLKLRDTLLYGKDSNNKSIGWEVCCSVRHEISWGILKASLFALVLLIVANLNFLGKLAAQDIDMNAPILPLATRERYGSEEEALAKAENGSVQEKAKAAITLFLLSRDAGASKNKKRALDLGMKSSDIINRIYRRNRNDIFLALMSGQINLYVADQANIKLKDKISFTNRGLANFEFSLPNIPDNLEAKLIYLRTTIYIPTFFKNLSTEQSQQIQLFLGAYDAAMAKLSSPNAKKRLEELRTHVLIIAAKVASRSRKTKGDVSKYLDQVETRFFPRMNAESNGDLVAMYQELLQ